MKRGKGYFIGIILSFFISFSIHGSERDLSIHLLLSSYEDDALQQNEILSEAQALNILFNGAEPPIDCATPLLLALINHYRSNSLSFPESLKYLLERPSLKEELLYKTEKGNFRIHYSVDRSTIDAIIIADKDKNGLPDYIETVGQGLEEARDFFIHQLGFGDSLHLAESSRVCDVYIKNLGGKITGMTIPLLDDVLGPQEVTFSFIVLDNLLVGDETVLKSIAAHQLAHAITLFYSLRASSWWSEATSIWLEDRLYSTLIRYYEPLSYRLKARNRSLDTDSLRLSQGNALWPFFLSEKDVNLIRMIWEEIQREPGLSILSIFSQLLNKTHQGSLESNYADFCLWTYFTGSRDDGNHFLFASYLPDPIFDSSYSTYPVAGIQAENPVEPLGASFIKFESEKSDGALIINFEGDQQCLWDVDFLLVSSQEPRYYRARMNIDHSGHGSIGIPWKRLDEIIMIVKNLNIQECDSGRFSYMATHDPSYPFELNFIEASEEQGIIVLLWETDSESDLYGWNVYRSYKPLCDFSKINEVFIPALGESSGTVLYKFLDEGAKPSIKYFYYVEGVTYQGLSCQSPVSSTKIKEETPPPTH